MTFMEIYISTKRVYISESLVGTKNPNWKPIEIPKEYESIRSFKILIKQQSEEELEEEEIIILEQEISFDYLAKVSSQMNEESESIPSDTIIFISREGTYVPRESAQNMEFSTSSSIKISQRSDQVKRSHTVRQTIELLNGIHQLDKIKETNRELHEKCRTLIDTSERDLTVQNKIIMLESYVRKQKLNLEKRQEDLQDARIRLSRRRSEIIAGLEDLHARKRRIDDLNKQAAEFEIERIKVVSQISSRKNHMMDDLRTIFPIRLKNPPEILRVPFPNSMDCDPSAFGYITHLISLLEKYLEIPLRYPVNPRGSTSSIMDRTTSEIFPLYKKGVTTEQYVKAIEMLNTNILQILHSRRLKPVSNNSMLENLALFMQNYSDSETRERNFSLNI